MVQDSFWFLMGSTVSSVDRTLINDHQHFWSILDDYDEDDDDEDDDDKDDDDKDDDDEDDF